MAFPCLPPSLTGVLPPHIPHGRLNSPFSFVLDSPQGCADVRKVGTAVGGFQATTQMVLFLGSCVSSIVILGRGQNGSPRGMNVSNLRLFCCALLGSPPIFFPSGNSSISAGKPFDFEKILVFLPRFPPRTKYFVNFGVFFFCIL